jgi:hypothetical protein
MTDPLFLYTTSEASRALGIPLSRIRRAYLRGMVKPFALTGTSPLFQAAQLAEIVEASALATRTRIRATR